MTIKQKNIYWVVGGIVLTGAIVGVFIFINSQEVENQDTGELDVDNAVQVEKNVAGIAEYALSDNSLQYKTQVTTREIEDSQKECIVVELENVDGWNQLVEDRRTEIMEGLINTSRLQIDKTFGCVIVEHLNTRLIEGFWQDTGGYVIIEK